MENNEIVVRDEVVEVASGGRVNDVDFQKVVEDDFTPCVGKIFDDLEHAVEFYRIYGRAHGFGVRRSTTRLRRGGELKLQMIVCNRAGKYKAKKLKSAGEVSGNYNERRRTFRAVDCKARITVFSTKGVFVITEFLKEHNHELISIENREFLKMSNELSAYQKMLIISNSRLNIGATKTFKMLKEQVNGFQNVGASLNDFKNFHRDIKCFIRDQDAQIFIDRFKSLVETNVGFFFDYEVDEDGCLSRVIWADGVGRKNYSVFGDAVSFDPTYSTNKYSLVFTPFTGIDNHKRSVTFCGALIAKEDYESFNWVFSRFLLAMGGREPEFILTDQDPGIIKSVSQIFRYSRHRFCMWHLMNKVPVKYGTSSSDYHDFLKELNSIIWDEEIEAETFDRRWEEIMDEHGVGKGDWFEECFLIRRQWVMAHCHDLRMGSIMRTTQRSESENCFFKRFEHKSGTLVEFWMRFESAMDQQRHTQKKLDNDNKYSLPKLITNLPIEEDGAKIYTLKIFEEFQEELKYSMNSCYCRGYMEENEVKITTVVDANRDKAFVVKYNPDSLTARCTCRLFDRRGMVCRHIIWIFTSHGLKSIPSSCVARRWTKEAVSMNSDVIDGLDFLGTPIVDPKQLALTKLWSEIHEAVGFLQDVDVRYVEELSKKIRDFREDKQTKVHVSKEEEFEKLLGCKASSNVTIMPPKQSKNKGSGKRLLSTTSKAVAAAKKPKRMCNNCKQMANHDKRNCPNTFVERNEVQVDVANDLCYVDNDS